MPDHRKHRGKNPQDSKLFSEKHLVSIRSAVNDLSYLLTRGYSMNGALKVVGDRYFLNERQRIAIARCSCPDQSLEIRNKKKVTPEYCKGKKLVIDGYNLLITIESALSGGYIFKGRDGCFRDISSIHGSYKRVEETIPALLLIANEISNLKPEFVFWLLDAPVSNSGRLKQIIMQIAEEYHLPWTVELVNNPDFVLKKSKDIIVSSDSMILNETSQWLNLGEIIITKNIRNPLIIEL
jgi:hypothetical protein